MSLKVAFAALDANTPIYTLFSRNLCFALVLHSERRKLQPFVEGVEQDTDRNQYHHSANYTVDNPQSPLFEPVAYFIDEISQSEPPCHSAANQCQVAHNLMDMPSWYDEDELSEKCDEQEDDGRIAHGDNETGDEIVD